VKNIQINDEHEAAGVAVLAAEITGLGGTCSCLKRGVLVRGVAAFCAEAITGALTIASVRTVNATTLPMLTAPFVTVSNATRAGSRPGNHACAKTLRPRCKVVSQRLRIRKVHQCNVSPLINANFVTTRDDAKAAIAN
jgi:hypothetical protein